MNQGLFLAIEGLDGSGKGTQFKLLAERLKSEGYDVAVYNFPQYGSESSYFVKEYLNGQYGSREQLGPYVPSLFYSLDRFDAAPKINADLQAGRIVVANRFIGSSMARQGAKFATKEERTELFNWLRQLEYNMLNIPHPDLSVVLSVPPPTARALIGQETKRNYTGKPHDSHEASLDYLEGAAEAYQQICELFPESYISIECTKDGGLMGVPAINNMIWERIHPMLKHLRKKGRDKQAAAPQPAAAHVFAPEKDGNPYVAKNQNGSYSITEAGKDYLSAAVTDTTGDVYAFTGKLSNATVAAAMARLSRRGDDMRATILDEFTEHDGKDEDLLRRVITAYGDDSVQQLTGIHMVVENASNLLTKKLEWGRLAAYLEQSTRYIFFDQKDEHDKFKYYTPETLDPKSAQYYNQQINLSFEKYSELVRGLTDYVRTTSAEPPEKRDGAWKAATRAQACDAARAVLPVATTATVGIFASGQALESLIMHLLSDELAEARTTGGQLLREARKVVPTFLERADKPDRGGAWVAHRAQTRSRVRSLAQEKQLQPMKGDDREPVHLENFWPKNELDLIPHILYEHSTLGLNELRTITAEWPYSEKESALQSYIGERLNRRHKPGRAFEVAHYSFDAICDYGVFRDLQRHRMVDAFEWQLLTPHYGFEIPKLVSEAGFDDLFESCFDLSFNLYQYLLEAGYQYESQYATLLGHKMRWKLTMNAREAYHFMELRTSPQGHPGYRKLAKQMYDKIAEVHPLIAAGMIFVNKDEDPELTRLAAERATQFKIDQLGKDKNN